MRMILNEDTVEEYVLDQDVLSNRWENVPNEIRRNLERAMNVETLIQSYSFRESNIAFTAVLMDGTSVAFDWDWGDGSTFVVSFTDGVEETVVVDDGGPTGFGASVDWIERLASRPAEYAERVTAHAKKHRQNKL